MRSIVNGQLDEDEEVSTELFLRGIAVIYGNEIAENMYKTVFSKRTNHLSDQDAQNMMELLKTKIKKPAWAMRPFCNNPLREEVKNHFDSLNINPARFSEFADDPAALLGPNVNPFDHIIDPLQLDTKQNQMRTCRTIDNS